MNTLTVSEHAKALSAQRKRLPKVCTSCGREYVGLITSYFCSNVCKQQEYRQRNRSDLNARRREKYRHVTERQVRDPSTSTISIVAVGNGRVSIAGHQQTLSVNIG